MDKESALQKAITRARQSAKRKARPFDLTLSYVLGLWENQSGRCAVSGIRFSDEHHDQAFVKTPFGPSLDRIDNSKGYTADNVRLVCMAANFAMNQWDDNVLRRIAHGVVETERVQEGIWFKRTRKKLREAERAAERMTGEQLAHQKRVIAGLKRSITMGPARLSGAGIAARDTRRKNEI